MTPRFVLPFFVLLACAAPKPRPAVALDTESAPPASCPTLGEGEPVDESMACKKGDAAACEADCRASRAYGCFSLALLHEEDEDHAGAANYYARSCQLGAAIGCTNFGAQIFAGKSSLEPQCAFALFDASCAAGEAFACGMMGRSYAEGFAVTADPARARTILAASCKEHGGFPCHWLGTYLRSGTFGEPDEAAARAAFERACATDFKSACAEVDAPGKAPGTKL